MNITVKTKEEEVKLRSGDVIALRRNGSIQYYVVTGENYLINLRCGSHRYKAKLLKFTKDLLHEIDIDSNATLIEIYSKEQWEMNLIEKGTK